MHKARRREVVVVVHYAFHAILEQRRAVVDQKTQWEVHQTQVPVPEESLSVLEHPNMVNASVNTIYIPVSCLPRMQAVGRRVRIRAMPRRVRGFLANLRLSAEDAALAERLHRHVDILAGLIGERNCWEYDHLKAAERYIRDQFAATGRAASEQSYSAVGKTVCNIILEQPGATRPDETIVLGAHYDSVVGTPGADDNASAVAGMLEVARELFGRRFKRTIRYVAFVNEEPPFYKSEDMGSLRYATQCRQRNDKIIGMVNLEMLGCFSDVSGSQEYPSLPGPLRYVRRILPKRGNFIVVCSDYRSWRFLASYAYHFRRHARVPMIAFPSPPGVMGPGMSDNWSFWEVGYPALMVTDTSFYRNKNYHMASDTPETLCYPMMARVVRGVAGALARLAGEM